MQKNKKNKYLIIASCLIGIWEVINPLTTIAEVLPKDAWSIIYVDDEATSIGKHAENVFDYDVNTIWHTNWMTDSPALHPHELQIDLGNVYVIDGFKYTPRQELSNGRIDLYEFYISLDGLNWGKPVSTGFFQSYGTTPQEVSFPSNNGQYIRLIARNEINKLPYTSVAEIDILGNFPVGGNYSPEGRINKPSQNITVTMGSTVQFSGEASDIDGNYPLSYHWTFGDPVIDDVFSESPGGVIFPNAGVYKVSFEVTDALGNRDPSPASMVINVIDPAEDFPLSQEVWSIHSVDSQELKAEMVAQAEFVIDGNSTTFWHTEWAEASPPTPHEIAINLGSASLLNGLRYLPRQDMINGRIDEYHVFISRNGIDWGEPAASGYFDGSANESRLALNPQWGQFIKLVSVNEINGNNWTSVAEINVDGNCSQPYVKIISPQTNSVVQSPNLQVTVSVCLDPIAHAGWGVEFVLNEGEAEEVVHLPADGVIKKDTFKVIFPNLSGAMHDIEAYIVNESGERVKDSFAEDYLENIALGNSFVAVGDSLASGYLDDVAGDNISKDKRNSGGGFTPILNDYLTAETGCPTTVINEGVGGAKTDIGLKQLPLVLHRNPLSRYFLVMYGANDNLENLSKESYKETMQGIIDIITAAGKTPILGEIPYNANFDRNESYLVYNEAVRELAIENGIPVVPPNFNKFFEMHPEEQADGLHPNGKGYQSMARLWFEAITEANILNDCAPSILDASISISPKAINLRSKNKWIKAYIELPKSHSIEDIERTSVAITKINGTDLVNPLHADGLSKITDRDKDGISELNIRFSRKKLQKLLNSGKSELTISCMLSDNTMFEGNSIIRVKRYHHKSKRSSNKKADDRNMKKSKNLFDLVRKIFAL